MTLTSPEFTKKTNYAPEPSRVSVPLSIPGVDELPDHASAQAFAPLPPLPPMCEGGRAPKCRWREAVNGLAPACYLAVGWSRKLRLPHRRALGSRWREGLSCYRKAVPG